MTLPEQQILAALLDNTPEYIYYKDRLGRFLRVSRSHARVFGMADPADVIGKTDFDFFSEEHARQAFQDEQEIIRTGRPISKEEKETWPDRPDTWVMTTKMPLYAEDGQIIGTFGISKDITERKQMEDALRRSQAMLSDAVTIAHLGYWEYDFDSDLFTFSDPFYAVFKTTADREGGYSMPSARYAERFVHEDDRALVAREIQKAQTSTEAVFTMQVEHKIYYADGTTGYISARATGVRNEHGRLVKTVGVNQDITERKRVEMETEKRALRSEALANISRLLSSSTTRYTSLLNNLSHLGSGLAHGAFAIWLVSEDGQSLEPVALSLSELILENNRVAWAHTGSIPIGYGLYGRVIQSGETIFYEHISPDLLSQIFHPDGKPWLAGVSITSLVIVPLKAQGAIIGLLSAFCLNCRLPFTGEDVAFFASIADHVAMAIVNARLLEQVQRQNSELEKRVDDRTVQLLQSNAELIRALRVKDEFMANMSHELRTPLNTILTLAEALEEGVYGPLQESQVKKVQVVAESGQHLLNVINDILDLARIETGSVKYQPVPVNLQMVSSACLRMIHPQAVKKHLQVSLEIDARIDTLPADERYLKQMLVNLLSNAVKFTLEGGKIGLMVEGNAGLSEAHFIVWDTGIGIAPEYLGRLFKPFMQVDSSLSRPYEGTGLGLALVAHLARLHGGRVWVESEPFVGSRFTIALPLQTEEEENNRPTRQTGGLAAQAAPGPQVRARPRRLVIAEDNPTNYTAYSDYLTQYGYLVYHARNGLEVIELAGQVQPDLILMDIQMPVMNGLEAIQRLRADPARRGIPIIALTALAMPGDRERCLEAGAVAYLAKPISIRKIVQVIEQHLPA